MNLAVLNFALGLALFLSPALAPASPAAPEQLWISGRAYVRLSDWAKANGYEMAWLKRDETLRLSNGAAKILLAVDSRDAEINGLQVWLLFPVLERNARVYISQTDLLSTLHPVLYPPKSRPGTKLQTVCLDPGHGGKDPGYRVGSAPEKQYTLLLAQELRQQLRQAGFKVTLTRTSDAFIELPTRPELARKRNADVFISLHFNAVAGGQDAVQGAEVYCLTPAGAPSTNSQGEGGQSGPCAGNRFNDRNLFMAYQMQKSLVHDLGAEDRGVHRARFAVLRDAAMPAVLIEAGFMSNPAEGRKILSAAYRKQIARAIVEGLTAYKRTVEGA